LLLSQPFDSFQFQKRLRFADGGVSLFGGDESLPTIETLTETALGRSQLQESKGAPRIWDAPSCFPDQMTG
jgi:hypothetical protein